MSDIVLFYPKTGMDIGSTVAPPHSLLCVAAPLEKAGYKVKIIDQRVNSLWKAALLWELAENPIFVGITAMTGSQIKFAVEAARIIRSCRNTPIVWGGAHPSTMPEQTLESGLADYICVGEVDETIVDIANNIAKGKAEKIIGSPLPDVEKLLPLPWHLIDVNQYIHPDFYIKKGRRTLDIGQTSRGCPFQCGFCSSASIRERKWRAMSADKSIDMIRKAVRNFSLTGIWLRDDEFYIDSNRAAAIAEGIMPLDIKWYTSGTRVDVFNKTPDEIVTLYKMSGAHTLKFGAESGNNRILKLMNKGITREETLKANLKCKEHDIVPAFALMCGFPTETFSEMNDTIDMARQIRRDNPSAQFETMGTYTALPGTPMWNTAVKYGLKFPDSLEGWGDNWIMDEYDPRGIRIPWFNEKERKVIGNINYISMLSNAVPNVLGSLENKLLGKILNAIYILPHKFYQWSFFGKHYKFHPELPLVRLLRRTLFYNAHKVLR